RGDRVLRYDEMATSYGQLSGPRLHGRGKFRATRPIRKCCNVRIRAVGLQGRSRPFAVFGPPFTAGSGGRGIKMSPVYRASHDGGLSHFREKPHEWGWG